MPPASTPHTQSLDASIQSMARVGDSEPTGDPSSALVFLITSSLTSGQRGARVWRTSHLLPRDASLFNTSSIFQVSRASSDRWDNSPPRLGEYEELILHTGRVNDGQIKTCFPRPLCLDKRPYVTCPTCLGVMRGHLGY